MKLPLWILNSSLLLIFFIMLLVNMILKQETPLLRVKAIIEEPGKKKAPIAINLERIYKLDLFDTFTPTEKTTLAQSFITPVPQPKPPAFTPPPEPKKQEFVQSLTITLKGIISSSNEQKSVAMIADETNKEKVYHLGDMIKDGQVLKIERDKLVILRANGQQETYLLRKEELEPGRTEADKWKYLVKKVDEQNYKVDPREFGKEIPSLASFIESLGLSTAYQKGKIIGVRVGKQEQKEIGPTLGFMQNDILLSINNVSTTDIKNRTKIYDDILKLKKGDIIHVLIKRNNIDQFMNYKLSKIGKPKKKMFIESAQAEPTTPPAPGAPAPIPGQPQAGPFKPGKEQEREKRIRDFEKIHQEPKNKEIMSDIRKRLLENMKMRTRDRRIR